MPGEAESRTRALRTREGIPLQTDTWGAILEAAGKLGVEPPSL